MHARSSRGICNAPAHTYPRNRSIIFRCCKTRKTKMKQASTVVVNVLFAQHVTMESRIKMKPASISEVPVQPAQLVTMESKIKMKQTSTVEDIALPALASLYWSYFKIYEKIDWCKPTRILNKCWFFYNLFKLMHVCFWNVFFCWKWEMVCSRWLIR